jgi:hypothetical protein
MVNPNCQLIVVMVTAPLPTSTELNVLNVMDMILMDLICIVSGIL